MKNWKNAAIQYLPWVLLITTLVALFGWILLWVTNAGNHARAMADEQATHTFKIYCVTASGVVLFDGVVPYAMVTSSGVWIKNNYNDRDYATVVTGQCRVTELKPGDPVPQFGKVNPPVEPAPQGSPESWSTQ